MRLISENLTKNYPSRVVFENISFQLNDNQKLVITGANGSGKTTLINVICSLVPKSSGKVIFEYEDRQYSGSEILQYIGIVSPDLYLYDELTANENLSFFARVAGITKDNFDSELESLGLKGRGDDLVRSYSSGMKQRLKYALALCKNPPLLFLDEPLANLDEVGKVIIDKIITQRQWGITIIATNELDELKYADQKIELGK